MTTKNPKRHKSTTRERTVQEQRQINQAAIDLLRSWRNVSEEEAQEQRETLEALRKGIDEERARLGMRLLFHDDRLA